MPHIVQVALESWEFPVWLTLTTLLTALVYLRGWFHLRSTSLNVIPGWRANSFFLGLLSTWVAVASPITALDEELLTVHMVQHLLLMTVAPPLIWLGAPLCRCCTDYRSDSCEGLLVRCSAGSRYNDLAAL
jgi:putative membrane protein